MRMDVILKLYFYDKLVSLRLLNMSDSSVKHVRGNRFDSIRYETCMILHGNLLSHLTNCCRHSANCSRHSINYCMHSANYYMHSVSCYIHSASGCSHRS
jgi:hypothetical protein